MKISDGPEMELHLDPDNAAPLPIRGSQDWDRVWADLAAALERVGLETTIFEGKRPATIEDFMLMQMDGNGVAGFKHRDTRNYVYVNKHGRIAIPKTTIPFNRGDF